MPREGKSNHQNFLKQFLNQTGMTPRYYRKYVSKLSKTVEQQLSAKDFKNIKYSQVPSVPFDSQYYLCSA